MECLSGKGIILEKISSIIETDPVGGPPGQGKFLNAVVKIHTDLSPHALLACLQSIELGLGRVRKEHHGPRTIDLDILFYDDVVIQTPELTIPHPLMHEREFVMNPLNEIAPEKYKELIDARA